MTQLLAQNNAGLLGRFRLHAYLKVIQRLGTEFPPPAPSSSNPFCLQLIVIKLHNAGMFKHSSEKSQATSCLKASECIKWLQQKVLFPLAHVPNDAFNSSSRMLVNAFLCCNLILSPLFLFLVCLLFAVGLFAHSVFVSWA